MKKFLCGLLLALLVVSSVSVPVAFAGRQDFELKNQTGRTIIALWVRPAKTKDWGAIRPFKDLLNGESCTIQFDRDKNQDVKLWDIKADFSDNKATEWYDFDLFNTYTITLEKDNIAEYK